MRSRVTKKLSQKKAKNCHTKKQKMVTIHKVKKNLIYFLNKLQGNRHEKTKGKKMSHHWSHVSKQSNISGKTLSSSIYDNFITKIKHYAI